MTIFYLCIKNIIDLFLKNKLLNHFLFKQEPFRNYKTMGCNLCCLKVDKPKIPIVPVNPDSLYPNIPDYPENWIKLNFKY